MKTPRGSRKTPGPRIGGGLAKEVYIVLPYRAIKARLERLICVDILLMRMACSYGIFYAACFMGSLCGGAGCRRASRLLASGNVGHHGVGGAQIVFRAKNDLCPALPG